MSAKNNNQKNTASKWTAKRVVAWIAIVLLVGMYVVTLIAALLSSPGAGDLFRFCLGMTIAVPIFAWILIYAIGYFTKKHTIASVDLLHSNEEARREMEEGVRSTHTPSSHDSNS